MSDNKYNPYVSQKPTDGDPSSRSYKRRAWKTGWQEFVGKEGWILRREVRRLGWRWTWRSKFKGEEEGI